MTDKNPASAAPAPAPAKVYPIDTAKAPSAPSARAAPVPPAAVSSAAPAKGKGRLAKVGLMLSLPVLLLVGGGYWYVTGGRYVSTENAYVQQDMVAVGPDVPGRVVEVAVRENEAVRKGQLLFRLDPAPYRVALDQARAGIASARLRVEQMRAAYQESLAGRQAARLDRDYQQRNFDRQQKLAKNGYAAQAGLDEARNDLQAAQQKVLVAEQSVLSAKAALGGDPGIATDDHPLVQEAVARRDAARLDLDHATVAAPADGVISQTARLLVGQYIPVGTPVLSLVETGDSWVEANFKETDLTWMEPGQTAEVAVDAYPGRPFEAVVGSIGAGTGSEFSLLPAQNATGNWVKVVQRVPVRLHLTGERPDVPLRSGLSVSVDVDTHHPRGLPGVVQTAFDYLGIAPTAKAAE
ncbi:MAG: HlyD family secretion protein [Geminicoccaceae bacterium]|nr:HlyD family secretion protein [Geminicoccaceae bacterium]